MRLLRLLIVCLLATTGSAWALDYPDKSRPIKIIVPFAAGGGVDLLARSYAKAINDITGLTVVIDNKAGAEAVIGVQAFMASPPDGYTLLISSSSPLTLNPVMIPNLPYDPVKDFVPLVGLGRTPFVMNLGPSTQFKTAKEFVAAARANPGKYTCASASATTRMGCELLQATSNIKVLNVPYKSAGAAMTALAAGEVDTHITDPGSAKAQWQSNRVRPVAVASQVRSTSMAQLPTLKEEGIANFNLSAWFAAYMPAKTPPEVADAMRTILRKAIHTKTIADMLAGASIEPLDVSGADLAAMNRNEIEGWKKLVRTANIKFN